MSICLKSFINLHVNSQEDVKRKALMKAFNKHNKLMALAQNGEGGFPLSLTCGLFVCVFPNVVMYCRLS